MRPAAWRLYVTSGRLNAGARRPSRSLSADGFGFIFRLLRNPVAFELLQESECSEVRHAIEKDDPFQMIVFMLSHDGGETLIDCTALPSPFVESRDFDAWMPGHQSAQIREQRLRDGVECRFAVIENLQDFVCLWR